MHNNHAPLFSLTSTPRCPKASHACDAANLGWLLLVLNELRLLGPGAAAVVHPADPAQPQRRPPRRSLAQLLGALRRVPPQSQGPAGHHHGGICDPVPAFRAAVDDVYNSFAGLTLSEVRGGGRGGLGWALSGGEEKEEKDEGVEHVELGVLAAARERSEVGVGGLMEYEFTRVEAAGTEHRDFGPQEENIVEGGGEEEGEEESPTAPHDRKSFTPDEPTCPRILSRLSTSDDLYAAALTNRTFHAAFKTDELALMRRLVRANRRLTLSALVGRPGEAGVLRDHRHHHHTRHHSRDHHQGRRAGLSATAGETSRPRAAPPEPKTTGEGISGPRAPLTLRSPRTRRTYTNFSLLRGTVPVPSGLRRRPPPRRRTS